MPTRVIKFTKCFRLYENFWRAIMSFCLKFVKKNEIFKSSQLVFDKVHFDSNLCELNSNSMSNTLSLNLNSSNATRSSSNSSFLPTSWVERYTRDRFDSITSQQQIIKLWAINHNRKYNMRKNKSIMWYIHCKFTMLFHYVIGNSEPLWNAHIIY